VLTNCVLSSGYKGYRLVNGSDVCSGRVEIEHGDTWGTLCDHQWDLQDAGVLCRQLHCGYAVNATTGAYFGEGQGYVRRDHYLCNGAEKTLSGCSVSIVVNQQCSHRNDAGVICSATENLKLRLVKGRGECEGRVEVYYNGTWGTVCDDSWDLTNANVVCRQLRCGHAIHARGSAFFGSGSGKIWLDDLNCSGSESTLLQCPSREWGQHDCSHKEDAGVLCSAGKYDKLRLVGGETNCSGRLEVWYSGSWGTVSDDSWDLTDTEVVCRQLGCGAAESIPGQTEFGEGNGTIWLDEVHCSGKEMVLQDCRSSPWGQHDCSHKEDFQVKCKVSDSDDVRLVNGRSPCAGTVEVYKDRWRTVCAHIWNNNDAAVVCRQLGCGSVIEVSRDGRFGRGFGQGRLWAPQCRGSESKLTDCSSGQWGDSNCPLSEVAGVICSERKEKSIVRLTGRSHACSGRVEVQYKDRSWSKVCAEDFDFNAAKVVCRDLECGFPRSVMGTAELKEGVDQIFNYKFQCKGEESNLRYCTMSPITKQSCSHKNNLQLICSGYRDYRLVDGRNDCSGRVELQFRDAWGSVCDHEWDLQDADVLCQQCNCGYAIATPGGAAFGEGNSTIWADEFQCKGNESSLWECPIKPSSYHSCTHKNDAGVMCSGISDSKAQSYNPSSEISSNTMNINGELHAFCSENLKLRLVNGRGECEGRVEVYYNGTWGTVCDDSWDLADADVVCRQLRCGHTIHTRSSAFFGSGSGKIWLDDLRCSGSESALSQCPSRRWGQHDCRHKEDAGVMCSGFKQLRLVSESEECSGKLEVFYNGSWGSVCYNNMNKGTAGSFCRHLKCGQQKQITSVTVTDSKVRWLDNVKCYGHEMFIWQCPSSRWGENRCTDSEIAQLTCSDSDKLWLVGGETNCSGRLEVWYSGSWGTICDDSWDLTDAEVVCRQLGCGAAESIPGEAEFGKGTGPIWLDDVSCSGKELVLQDCRSSPWGQHDCSHKEDVQVKC
uniref:SRCR domain-containing protein n=1 Tax=Latimeria chalumnae TaxID=7897 RepID=H3A428_LATCH